MPISALASDTESAGQRIKNGMPLRSEGTLLRNSEGQVVQLRGVNLGGWLSLEPWMTPMDSSGLHDEWSALDVLTKRFGKETFARLFDVYRDTYIRTNDLDNIASFRLNVIRLPVWYRTLQDEDGAWRPDAFMRMDWLVREAWKRNIYTVIDLHGARADRATKMALAASARKT